MAEEAHLQLAHYWFLQVRQVPASGLVELRTLAWETLGRHLSFDNDVHLFEALHSHLQANESAICTAWNQKCALRPRLPPVAQRRNLFMDILTNPGRVTRM